MRILPPPTLHSFRRLHSINVGSFLTDLKSSQLITVLGPLLSAYNTTVFSLLDKHTPIVTKLSRCQSPSNPWFSTTLLPPSSLSATNITSSSHLPKRVLLQPYIFSLQQLQTSLADSQKKLLHRRSSPLLLLVLHLQTALLLFSLAKYPNSVFHWQPCYIISALTLSSCHSP